MSIEPQNGNYDLSAVAAVYLKTATVDGEWEFEIVAGDGVDNPEASACTFTVEMRIDGAIVGGTAQHRDKPEQPGNTAVRFRTNPEFIRAGQMVTITLESSNTADTDVDVTVTPRLVQVNAAQIGDSTQTADNVRSVFLGTGDVDDVDLKAKSLHIINDTGDAVVFRSTHATGVGFYVRGFIANLNEGDAVAQYNHATGVSGTAQWNVADGGGASAGQRNSGAFGDIVLANGKFVGGLGGSILVGLTNGTITEGTFDGETAFPLAAADAGESAVARPGDAMALTEAERAALASTVEANIDIAILPLQPTAYRDGALEQIVLTAYQHCRIVATLAIYDAAGAAVDLSGKNVALVAWGDDGPANPVFALKNYDGDTSLAVSGEDGNQVSIDGADTNTQTAGQWRWILRNVTDDLALAQGLLIVKAAADVPT